MSARAGRALAALLAMLAVAAAALPALTQSEPGVDERVAHEVLWLEATAAVLAIAAVPDPAALPVAPMKAAQARLERAVVALINTRPPLDALGDHLALLPFVQEVAGAARAVIDAVEAKDEPGVASAREWLGESIAQLALATREARAPRP